MKDDQQMDLDEQLLIRLVHKTGRTSGALRSATQALLNGADEEPAIRRELLREMERELIELQRVLDNVIQLKAIERGTVSLDRRVVLPGPLLRRLIDRWQQSHADRELAWRVDLPDALPCVVVDEDKLEQGLNNLLANTVRQARPGSHLGLAASMDGEWLVIRLTCNQPAFGQDDYDHAADLLHTADAEGRFPVSMGLGLYVTRLWIREEGGELEAIRPSGADGWGGFALRLPLRAASAGS